jgi:hypothetical protein
MKVNNEDDDDVEVFVVDNNINLVQSLSNQYNMIITDVVVVVVVVVVGEETRKRMIYHNQIFYAKLLNKREKGEKKD